MSQSQTPVSLSSCHPSFQMPIRWPVSAALHLKELAHTRASRTPSAILRRVIVEGFSTPSTTDVGGASVRLRLDSEVGLTKVLNTNGESSDDINKIDEQTLLHSQDG